MMEYKFSWLNENILRRKYVSENYFVVKSAQVDL